ncbi:MAG: hypothetical protein LC114_07795 [Bryobacterales bacterium]|nr:hypothetical protein [Bryobacterales bacterium]
MARATKAEKLADAGLDDSILAEAVGTFEALPTKTHQSLAEWLRVSIQPSGGREMSTTPILRAFKGSTGITVSADALAGALIQCGCLPAARFEQIDTPRGTMPTIWLFFASFTRAYKIERQRLLMEADKL